MAPKKVARIVLACCYLHNYILKQNRGSHYFHGADVVNNNTGKIQEGSWRSDPQQLIPLQPTQNKNSTISAKEVRNNFCQNFNTEGAVPWQWKMVGQQPPAMDDDE